jgi:hypothetical protein
MQAPAIVAVTTIAWASAILAETVNFDNLKTGTAPAGWTATKTGSGEVKWTIESDSTAPSKPNVLKQSGQATFPICIKDDTSLQDGFAEVKFKPISGKEDQAGGLVWRVKDSNNYYVARANALEDNVTIYDTVSGGARRGSARTRRCPLTSGTRCAWTFKAAISWSLLMARRPLTGTTRSSRRRAK